MDKFFFPVNRIKFIEWLLYASIDNGWTIVIEYSDTGTLQFLKRTATVVPLPETSVREYDFSCELTAIINPMLIDNFIEKLMAKSHVLSVHSEEEMIFLIADDFHEECFSCTQGFYNKYYEILDANELIDTHWKYDNN
jgi:hypothetical protein